MDSVKGKELIYDWLPSNVREPMQFPTHEMCNSMIIVNQGDSIVTINSSIILYPGVIGTRNGESFTFGGNAYEIYKGNVYIQFTGGTVDLCIVLQKIYNDKWGTDQYVNRF